MCAQGRLFVVCVLSCLLFCFSRCSMRRSGATFVEQHTFCCITCGISGKNGICATCAVRNPPSVFFRVYKVALAIWNGTEGRREYANRMWTETGRQTDRKTGILTAKKTGSMPHWPQHLLQWTATILLRLQDFWRLVVLCMKGLHRKWSLSVSFILLRHDAAHSFCSPCPFFFFSPCPSLLSSLLF